MLDIKPLYNELKQLETRDNIILPKDYLRKFLLMTILILQDNRNISREEIFKYLKDELFEIPSSWNCLDKNKQEKFYNNLKEIINLLK